MPLLPSVRTRFAPRALSICRRSTDIESGMVSVSLSPLAAQTKARAMPVFPLVGSMMWVFLFTAPDRSPASIMALPMRSLTEERGLKNSHLR